MLNNNAKIGTVSLYRKQYDNVGNSNNRLAVLSELENKVLTEKLLKINQPEVSRLCHKFMTESDPICLRTFLDINKDWHGLFNTDTLNRLIVITTSKLAFNLWCKFISSSPSFTFSDFTSKLNQFEVFIKSLNDNDIHPSKVFQLQQLTVSEFTVFLSIFAEASNKTLQIQYACLPITDMQSALDLLNSGYTFISSAMIDLTRAIPNEVIIDSTKFLQHILVFSNVGSMHGMGLLYFMAHNRPMLESFNHVMGVLYNLYYADGISANVYLVISKLSIILTDSLESTAIIRLVNKSIEFYKIFGDKLFSLIEPEGDNTNINALEDMYSLIEYLLKIKLNINLDDYTSLDELYAGLQKLQLQHLKSISQPRDLDIVLSEFKGPNLNVKFPLSDTQLDIIKEQLCLVGDFENQLATTPLLKLADLVTDIKKQLHYTNTGLSRELRQELICKLIAIAMRAFVQYFNIYPYDVQCLCVLGMLLPRVDFKGVLAQVKTGEGKSTIVALLTLILACEGKAIDIITSTEYLSVRDEQKYKAFFKFFGVTTSNICNPKISREDFAGQVIYGTNYNFEFSILFDKLYLHGNRVHYADNSIMRPLQVAIVDEVDNMLVDKALNSARISYSSKRNYITLYVSIYDFIKSNCQNMKPDWQVRMHCKDLADQYDISEIHLNQLIDNAYQACFELNLNTHYCIKKVSENNKNSALNIVIIDRDTGRLNEGSRWQHGLHQFLEYKHGLPITEDSQTLGALSHPAFFSYYSEIYGVTGTIGTKIERQEVAEIYNLAAFDVPTYRPTLRIQLESIIAKDEKQFNQLLLNEVDTMIARGRPTLILCSSVESSKSLYKLLRIHTNDPSIQLLNDVQHQDEEFIVCSAGSTSRITVATNAAGRGTDIPIQKDALKNGGLHVLFTFFPHNERVEAQGAGRAGRQGNLGSYRILIPHDDELLMQCREQKNSSHILQLLYNLINLSSDEGIGNNLLNLSDNTSVEELHEYREQMVLQGSESRRTHSVINLIQHKILEQFCEYYKVNSTLPQFNKHLVLSKWAEFYTSLEDIKIPPISNNKDVAMLKQIPVPQEYNSQFAEYERTLNQLFTGFMEELSPQN